MYCPNCAAPIEGVKFCRGCGTNVALVPQAISGELAELTEKPGRRLRERHRGTPSMERAASSFFTGIGFIFVALAVARFMPGGSIWWFWMLIPGFACIGSGIGQYMRVKSERELINAQPRYTPAPYTAAPQVLPSPPSQLESPAAPTTSNLGEKSSVTEHTTRHLT